MTFGQLKSLIEGRPAPRPSAPNAAAQLRMAKQKGRQALLNRAGAAVVGSIASKAGLNSAALSSAERRIASGGRINPALAQKLAKAALGG